MQPTFRAIDGLRIQPLVWAVLDEPEHTVGLKGFPGSHFIADLPSHFGRAELLQGAEALLLGI